jgi:DNA polymerase-3 subunit epsilon
MRAQGTVVCGCFPTGRHYPGIADRVARAVALVEGLASEHEAAAAWLELPIVVIDFETTGVSPENDRVIEIGLVGFTRGQLDFQEAFLVNPGIPIPEESRAVHGITDEELDGAPSFPEVLVRIAKLLEGRVPVAYNASFDRGFLHNETRRAREAGIAIDGLLPPALRDEIVWLDPLVWARVVLEGQKSYKLGEIAAHLGVSLERAHRAAGDAEATGRVLFAIAHGMPKSYAELVRLQSRYAAVQEMERNRFRR